MRKILLGLFLLLSNIITGMVVMIICHQPRRTDLPGRYSGVAWGWQQILMINPDGTFAQTLTSGSNQVLSTNGRWTVTGDNLSLTPFIDFEGDGSNSKPKLYGGTKTITWDVARDCLSFGLDDYNYVRK